MPIIDGKHLPYTRKNIKMAKEAKKRKFSKDDIRAARIMRGK